MFPYSREDFAAAEPDPSQIPNGEEQLTGLKNRVLDMVADMEARLSETPVCDILNDAVAFWTGDTQTGIDRDYAEILMRFSQQRSDDTPPDFYYVLGRFTGGFRILPDPKELGQDYISIAAVHGHPEAALSEGQFQLANGDPAEAQVFLLIAAQAGSTEARHLLSDVIREFGTLTDRDDQQTAERLVKNYNESKCTLPPLE